MNKTLWEIFTSKKEYSSDDKDKYGRILFSSMNPGYITRPVVSEFLFNNGFRPFYPENRRFAVALSHDVDVLYMNRNIYQNLKYLTKSALSNRNLLRHSLGALYNNKIWPEYHLNRLLEINEKYNIISSFYFLAVDKINIAYNYNLRELKTLLGIIESGGNEVGLHGSYNAYFDIDQLIQEKQELEYVIDRAGIGYRNHNLNFDVRTTWSILESAGFKYDTTFGFADHVGFRNGMCYPFHPYDLLGKRYYDILEIPLHCMDVTLFKYMNLSYHTAFARFSNLVAEVENVNGVFTFLWHNTNVTGEMKAFYEKCLDHLTMKGAWITSSIGIYNWWKKNKYIEQMDEIMQNCC